MVIDDIVAIAKWVHDAEGVNLGSSSTREYRNAFWARVVGIIYWGHPLYNLQPDPRWHLKSAGGGRPQSDDIVVLMPSREHWDCIPRAGADDYSFRATYHGVLEGQDVYPPPIPDGTAPPPVEPPPVEPPPPPLPSPDLSEALTRLGLIQTGMSFLINQYAAQRNDIEILHRQLANTYEQVAHARLEVQDVRKAVDRPLSLEASNRFLGSIKGTVKP